MASKKNCETCGGKLYHSSRYPSVEQCPANRERRLQEKRAGNKRVTAYRKSQGLCVACGNAAVAGLTKCELHRLKGAETCKTWRATLVARGLCYCGRVAVTKFRCTECAEKESKSSEVWRRRILVKARIYDFWIDKADEAAAFFTAIANGEDVALPEWTEDYSGDEELEAS